MSKKLKFAVIGCGSIGKRHIAVLDAEPEAELVGICDIDSKTTQELAEKYKNLKIYSDYKKLLTETDATIINIATPHSLHAEMCIEAANFKKHILVEKPMSLNSLGCKKMIIAAEQNGVKLFVVKQSRYNTPIFLTKQLGEEMAKSNLY